MLKSLESMNDRRLLYVDITLPFTGWQELSTDNWLALVIADPPQLPLLYDFAQGCLDKNVRYVCGTGKAASEIDDAFDFAIVDQQLKSSDRDLTDDDFEDTAMTIWDERLDDCLWFAAYSAHLPYDPIDSIVVCNLTGISCEQVIQELAWRFRNGWIPEN